EGSQGHYTNAVVTGGNIYFTFTENTNRAKVPLKFATPPFTTNPSATNQASITNVGSGFEAEVVVDPAGFKTYSPGSTVDGWDVLNSRDAVDVIQNTNLALNSTQFLAMAAGTISRTVPVTAGREYRLKFGKTDQR